MASHDRWGTLFSSIEQPSNPCKLFKRPLIDVIWLQEGFPTSHARDFLSLGQIWIGWTWVESSEELPFHTPFVFEVFPVPMLN